VEQQQRHVLRLNDEQAMKSTSAAVIALIASSNVFARADLYTLSLKNGLVIRYTDFDVDLTYGGHTWTAGGPVFQRGQTRTVIGLEVGTLDLEIYPKPTDTISGITFISAAAAGYIDGATIDLDYAIMAAGSTTVLGTVSNFSGTASEPSITRFGMSMTVSSPLDALNAQLPRNLCSPSCIHTLFDSGCALVKTAFGVSGSVTGSGTASAITTTLSNASGYFDAGTIVFTSGALNGVESTVKTYVSASGAISFNYPLPSAPAGGVTFTAYPGCDKMPATCSSRFSNIANIKCMPFVPIQETAY
jgi:uncharacterized phage protein (TIGR02218 family)